MSTIHHDYHTFDLPYQNSGLDAELDHAKHSRGRRGGCCLFACCLGCFGFLFLIALAAVGIWYALVSGGADLMVSPETTVITEPLKSDGKSVDFFQAIQKMTEPDIQVTENGFRDVLLAFGQAVFEVGSHHDDADWQYREMCKLLDIDPLSPPLFSLENPRLIVTGDHKGLDVVQAAADKPHYFVPMVRQGETDLVFQSQPVAAYTFHALLTSAFQRRALSRFAAKEIDGAWKDALSSIRLFRFVTFQQAWRLVIQNQEDDTKTESLLTPVSEVAATLPDWTPEQLERAIKDLESLPNWQDRQTAFKMIQFTLLDLISATNDLDSFSTNVPIRGQVMVEMLRVIAFDWNLVAKELNSEIKAYEKLMNEAEGKSLDEQFDLLRLRQPGKTNDVPFRNEEAFHGFVRNYVESGNGGDALFTAGRSKLTGAFVGSVLVTWAAGEMYRLQLMEESRCQALRWVLALERYHREHQKYPDSLEELGVQPMVPSIDIEYVRWGAGYRLENKVVRLER